MLPEEALRRAIRLPPKKTYSSVKLPAASDSAITSPPAPYQVELAARLLHAAAVPVICINRVQFALSVPRIAEAAIGENVARRVVGKARVGDAVVSADSSVERDQVVGD